MNIIKGLLNPTDDYFSMVMVYTADKLNMSDRAYKFYCDTLTACQNMDTSVYNYHIKTGYPLGKGYSFAREGDRRRGDFANAYHIEPTSDTYRQIYLHWYKKPSYGKGPDVIEDTFNIIDYDPYAFDWIWYFYREDHYKEKFDPTWCLNDMVAKYRFFSRVKKDENGNLICDATAEELRLTESVMNFFLAVLDGLNLPGDRRWDIRENWPDDGSYLPQEQVRNYFLAKNWGIARRYFRPYKDHPSVDLLLYMLG